MHTPVTPDANVYAVAFLLALASGLLFGIVPVRQALRTDPYQIVKSGSRETASRRITLRDLLLGVQIAICAVLITSSVVAVRGLARSLHSNLGFQVQNTMLVDTDLSMAGYRGEAVSAMQKRMIDAVKTIPGVEAVGLADGLPLSDTNTSLVFIDNTRDLRPSNAAAEAMTYHVSPEYFLAAGTALVSGRTLKWHDDKNASRVAVVNREFARKIFGSVTNALGRHYKMGDGTRIQVIGIAEDGKYGSLTENPRRQCFCPSCSGHQDKRG